MDAFAISASSQKPPSNNIGEADLWSNAGRVNAMTSHPSPFANLGVRLWREAENSGAHPVPFSFWSTSMRQKQSGDLAPATSRRDSMSEVR
jgi:hypothetical protein